MIVDDAPPGDDGELTEKVDEEFFASATACHGPDAERVRQKMDEHVPRASKPEGWWNEWSKSKGLVDADPPTFDDEPELKPFVPFPLPPRETWREWKPAPEPKDFTELALPVDAVPPRSFFSRYDNYMLPLGVLREHNWGAACGLIAVSLGPYWRVATIDTEDLPCNPFVVLVSSSGGGKGLASRGLSSLVPEDHYQPDVPRSSTAYLEVLSEKPAALWYMAEAAPLFKQFASTHSADFPQWLTQAFDGETFFARWKGKQKLEVRSPCPVAVMATVEEGLLPPGLKDDVSTLFSGGLMSRLWLVAADRRENAPLPRGRDTGYGQWLCNWLAHWQATRPAQGWHRIELSYEARLELETWNISRGRPPSPLLAGTWARAPMHAQKLALIYHVSVGRTQRNEISAEHMVMAIKAVHSYLLPAHHLVAVRAQLQAHQKLAQRVLDTLKAGPLTVAELGLKMGLEKRRRDQVLADLAGAGDVRWTAFRRQRGRGESVTCVALARGEPFRRGESYEGEGTPPAGVLQLLTDDA